MIVMHFENILSIAKDFMRLSIRKWLAVTKNSHKHTYNVYDLMIEIEKQNERDCQCSGIRKSISDWISLLYAECR